MIENCTMNLKPIHEMTDEEFNKLTDAEFKSRLEHIESGNCPGCVAYTKNLRSRLDSLREKLTTGKS